MAYLSGKQAFLQILYLLDVTIDAAFK